jgi:hypothetical protein
LLYAKDNYFHFSGNPYYLVDKETLEIGSSVYKKVSDVRMAVVGIEGIPEKAADKLIEDLKGELPRRTTVAILSLYSNDPATSTYALEKIEQRFYDSRYFSIIEKRFIDVVRREKRLQESDDIDPAKAAALAREEGWNVVVIGEISGSGSSRRLTLRAIDAEKGTILSRTMENF